MPKVPDKTLWKMVLNDAIAWQESLCDSLCGSEWEKDAKDTLDLYRDLRERKYGSKKTTSEQNFNRATKDAVLVDVKEYESKKD